MSSCTFIKRLEYCRCFNVWLNWLLSCIFLLRILSQGLKQKMSEKLYKDKKQINVSFRICPVIDNEFYHNTVKKSFQIHPAIASCIHSYFGNVMMKFMTNNRTDAWKTDINLSLVTLPICESRLWFAVKGVCIFSFNWTVIVPSGAHLLHYP